MPRRRLFTTEDFSKGLVTSVAPENVPAEAAPDARNLIIRDPGEASTSLGWGPIENVGIAGRILHTDDFKPSSGERFAPSVIVPDTTDAALFDLNNRWVTNASQITLKNGFILRVASGSIADTATGDIVERSTDGGVTFSSSATFTNGTGETQTINGGVILQLQNGNVIFSVNLSGATVNVVDTQTSTDNGGSWSAQTHPNTSTSAPSEELTTFYYQIRGGTLGTRLLITFIRSGAAEVHFSDDNGASFTAATTDPGGSANLLQAYEAQSGRELTVDNFSAVTAGTVYLRPSALGSMIFRSTNGGVDWASTTEINFPYGLYFARLDRQGLPSGAQVGEFYVVGDGRQRTVLFNGHVANALGIKAPTVDPTTGVTGTGKTGRFRAFYTFFDSLTGQESGPSDFTEQDLSNENLTITPTASTESQVDRIKFYIQKVPSDTVIEEWATAYFAGEADNATAAFTVDDTEETILLRAIPIDKAIGGANATSYRLFEEHQSRLAMAGDVLYNVGNVSVTNDSATVTGSGTSWHVGMEGKFFKRDGDTQRFFIQLVNSATSITLATSYQGDTQASAGYEIFVDPTRVVFSQPLRPWSQKSHLGQPMDIPFGNRVTALHSYSNDMLLVWTEDDTFLVSGSLQSSPTFNKQLIIPRIGCISHHSVVTIDDTVFWISKTGFESWSRLRGYLRLSDGRVADRFDTHRFGEELAFAIQDTIGEEIMIFTTEGATERAPDTRHRYFYKRDSFMSGEFQGNMTAATASRTSGDLTQVRLMFWDGTNARPMSLNRSVAAEGIVTGTLSGEVSSATASAPVTLTIASGALETADEGIDGRFLTTVRTSDGTIQVVQIASSTPTIITATAGTTWPSFTPASGDRWAVGAIDSLWQTPDLVMDTQDALRVTEVQLAFEIV